MGVALIWGAPKNSGFCNIYTVAETRFQIWSTAWVCQLAHHKITQTTKVGSGMVLYKIWRLSLIFFLMAEVAMAVPNKWYYMERLQILM